MDLKEKSAIIMKVVKYFAKQFVERGNYRYVDMEELLTKINEQIPAHEEKITEDELIVLLFHLSQQEENKKIFKFHEITFAV